MARDGGDALASGIVNLLLCPPKVVAIVPAPLLTTNESQEPLDAIPVLAWWVRGLLLVITAGLVTVFVIAISLNPYREDGTARTMETHRQLNLPECSFKHLTGGWPCPSCGMTTSFALLMHGDVINSARANVVGTLLAAFCLALIPWSLISIYLGRPLFIVSIEPILIRVIIVFLLLLLTRWVIVLAHLWWTRT
jgi:hypothetical protein